MRVDHGCSSCCKCNEKENHFCVGCGMYREVHCLKKITASSTLKNGRITLILMENNGTA